MKLMKRGAAIILVLLTGLSAYEYYRLNSAQTITVELFRPYSAPDFNGLKWKDLGVWQQSALIKVEDPNFFSHNGTDFSTKGAGFTTITQAIVKKLYFKHFTPGFKKIEQSVIARYAVTPVISKDVQLTAFFNVAYFGDEGGREIKGFADASQTYFGKPVAQLGQDEFLGLIAMLIAPNELKPRPDNKRSAIRVARIKNLIAGRCEPRGLMDVYLDACD
jgi:membrane peptidoglycan carboxypeptidase